MSSFLSTLSPQQLRRAATIKEQMQSLENELSRLLCSTDTGPIGKIRKKRTMSVAAKAKIATAQKARWAKFRAIKM
jgi:hypothetical protein